MKRTIEFVLEQSSQGHHHLFDPDLIRRAFHARMMASSVSPQTIERCEGLLGELRGSVDLDTQRERIDGAPDDVKELFVQLYFQYLDRFMHRQGVQYH